MHHLESERNIRHALLSQEVLGQESETVPVVPIQCDRDLRAVVALPPLHLGYLDNRGRNSPHLGRSSFIQDHAPRGNNSSKLRYF